MRGNKSSGKGYGMKPPTEHEDTDLGDDYPPISEWHERQTERADRIRTERKDREWEGEQRDAPM